MNKVIKNILLCFPPINKRYTENVTIKKRLETLIEENNINEQKISTLEKRLESQIEENNINEQEISTLEKRLESLVEENNINEQKISILEPQREKAKQIIMSVLHERNIFASKLSVTDRDIDWSVIGVDPPYMYYKGYSIPEFLVRLTGGGPETFEQIVAAHQKTMEEFLGINQTHVFLEIGCGIGRDAITLTEKLSEGRYIGVDIILPSINWCSNNITTLHPNFSFYHFDVDDQLHNPSGTIATIDIKLPAEDSSVDRIILWSVFTHMYEKDILHYMKEFRRVLKPDGKILATCFVFNEKILEAVNNIKPNSSLRFEHELSANCRINDPDYPTGAIAYKQEVFESLVKESGLKIVEFCYGSWSGYHNNPKDGQDFMVLAKE